MTPRPHSEQGTQKGEHRGRSSNPVIKVHDLAWLEFQKPDLVRAEAFAHAFGFTTVSRSGDQLQLRGSDPGSPCVLVRRGPTSRFIGTAFIAADEVDIRRLAEANSAATRALPETIGGLAVDLVDPSGMPVRVVAGTRQLEALDWYLHQLGMIVSDFLFFPGQRDRGPTMSFIRCDRGQTPADHHTIALALGPTNRYIHSAYQVCDLDALAAGGEYLKDAGYQRSWGIGRHVQGSQIFDYWRDPEGFMVEHFSDGDMFDCTLEPGWAPFTGSGLAQWGPSVTKDFLGTNPRSLPHEARSMISALRADNEFDFRRLIGLMKVAAS